MALEVFIRLSREDMLILLWHWEVGQALDARGKDPDNWRLFQVEREVILQRYYDCAGGVRWPGRPLGMARPEAEFWVAPR